MPPWGCSPDAHRKKERKNERTIERERERERERKREKERLGAAKGTTAVASCTVVLQADDVSTCGCSGR